MSKGHTIYTDGLEHQDRMFREKDYAPGEARRTRDREARQLRMAGWTVTCKMWHFYDLGTGPAYCYEARGDAWRVKL